MKKKAQLVRQVTSECSCQSVFDLKKKENIEVSDGKKLYEKWSLLNVELQNFLSRLEQEA